ncbi:MAG TPA: DUF4340 domain-containing protein, partial [Leucothrix sp.]|nr:DUF4340 domain-containing protein [Leucothrix sp.]
MMNKLIKILAAIAIVQVVITAMTWMGGSELQGQSDKATLLAFNKDDIDKIIIKSDKQEASLMKKDGKWQMIDAFPADQDKVNQLLAKLQGLKFSLPVATSEQALKRFKVADDTFERHISLLKNGNSVVELYLGTGAGARQNHARSADQDAVYTVAMGSHDAPAEVAPWQDKNILRLERSAISQVSIDGLSIVRESDSNEKDSITLWKSSTLPKDKLLNQKGINDNLQKLLSLRFEKVLGKNSKGSYGQDKPELKLSLTHTSGKRDYTFGKFKDSDNYVLKVSDREEYFEIANYHAKSLVDDINKEKWLLDKPKDSLTEKVEAPKIESSSEAESAPKVKP